MLARHLLTLVAFATGLSPLFAAQSFTIAVYNVENLFDADGVAVYDDYQPADYTPAHVVTKVKNVAAILSKFRGGAGPDIVMLDEIEIDQTPDSAVADLTAFAVDSTGVTLDGLAKMATLPPEWRGAPAEAWLLKALAEAGATGYTAVVGSDAPAAPGEKGGRAIKCVTLTKFPVKAVREYAITSARNILEVVVEVDGAPLYLFNNHWKSGAGDAKTESVRIENAEVLRKRIDEILAADPQSDIVIGGDFNSQYNQKLRYPNMPRTGINDVLGSQGDERALEAGTADLYNLWFELPEQSRGSDVYKNEWGTLMNIIVSRGLYDWAGVQYQDNSFGIARVVGLNADAGGAPRRWDGGGPTGSGYSDHLPVYAHFRTLNVNEPKKWMPLEKPSDGAMTGRAWMVDYSAVDLSKAIKASDLPANADLRDGTWTGKLFRVTGASIGTSRSMGVRFAGQAYDVYAVDRAVKDKLVAASLSTRSLTFYGELGTYKGKWQFVVKDVSWAQ